MSAPLKLLSDAWKESRKAELLKSLPHIQPLHHLSSLDIEAMVQASTFRAFDMGDIICQQGQAGSSFFCLEHGSVTIIKDGKAIATIEAVDYLGLQALQYQRSRSASVVAATSLCIVCELIPNAEQIQSIISSLNPDHHGVATQRVASPSLTAAVDASAFRMATSRLQQLRKKLGLRAKKASISYPTESVPASGPEDPITELLPLASSADSFSQFPSDIAFTLGEPMLQPPATAHAQDASAAPADDGTTPLHQGAIEATLLPPDIPIPPVPMAESSGSINLAASDNIAAAEPSRDSGDSGHISPQRRFKGATNAVIASERLLKDGKEAALNRSFNEGSSGAIIPTSHLRHHTPAAALRQGILEQELQLFDAALMKTFPNISSSAAGAIIQLATRQIGIPGAVIFNEGDTSSDMLFLASGCLDVCKHGHRTATIDGCNIVGHHAYLYHRPRSATVVVSTGPQCVYYIFSIDRMPAEADLKPGLWNTSTARVLAAKSSKKEEQAPGAAPQDNADLVAAEEDIGHFSPLSKRRMSMLLGEESSARRYSRDVLDYGESLQASSSKEQQQPPDADRDVHSPAESFETLDFRANSRQRPASGRGATTSHTSVGASPLLRPASSQSPPSPAFSSARGVRHAVVDISDVMSPLKATAAAASSRRSSSSTSPRSSTAAAAPVASQHSRTRAIQHQQSSSSTGAVTCIIFSAAWLLCLTQLEKTKMSGPRHALCRCRLPPPPQCAPAIACGCDDRVCRQLAGLAVSDDAAIRYLCSRLKMLPFAIKTASSHSPAPSPPSPDKAPSTARFGSSASIHRAQLQEAGLTPEIAALLPEPAAIVEILSEVATHRNAGADNTESIMSLMASMLQRSVRHAVASNFLRVWAHFLSREDSGDNFIKISTDCIVAMASDVTLGSATFVSDSCGAAGIVEVLCAGVAARLSSGDADAGVCTSMLRCLQLLVHHHLSNQGRLCACGGLATITQYIVMRNSVHQSSESMRWAVAIVSSVSSSSRAGFDAAVSCGSLDAVFMAGALCSAHTQEAIAGCIFDMVCSSADVAAAVKRQCDEEDVDHIQPFSLLLQSSHPDVRRVAHTIVTRLGKKLDDGAQLRSRSSRPPASQRWK